MPHVYNRNISATNKNEVMLAAGKGNYVNRINQTNTLSFIWLLDFYIRIPHHLYQGEKKQSGDTKETNGSVCVWGGMRREKK